MQDNLYCASTAITVIIFNLIFKNCNPNIQADIYSQELQHLYEDTLSKRSDFINWRIVVLLQDNSMIYWRGILYKNIDFGWSVQLNLAQ